MELNQKQQQILTAAEELFAQKGFIGTSVRDIASMAKVNVAMISYYFGSKEKLLQSLLISKTEQSRKLLNELKKDKHLDPWEKIDRIIDFYVDHLLENRKFHTIMTRQISLVQDEEITNLLVNIKRKNHALIQEIIKEGQQKNIFKKVNIPLTIGTVIGTISQVSMSRPFYKKLLKFNGERDEVYFKKLKPKLKEHLKSLMRGHLALNK